MKKHLFTSLFLTCALAAFTQTKGHRLGFQVGYLTSDVNSNTTFMKDVLAFEYAEGSSSGSGPSDGFSAGFHYGYSLSRSFSLRSAVLFSSYSEVFDGKVHLRNSPVIGMGDTPLPSDLVTEIDGRSHYYYLDFQAGLQVFLGSGRVRLFAFPFSEVNFFVGDRHSRTLTYHDGSTRKEGILRDEMRDYRPVNFTVGLGLGLDWQCAPRINLSLTPLYKSMLLTLDKNDLPDDRTSSLGLNLSIGYLLTQ